MYIMKVYILQAQKQDLKTGSFTSIDLKGVGAEPWRASFHGCVGGLARLRYVSEKRRITHGLSHVPGLSLLTDIAYAITKKRIIRANAKHGRIHATAICYRAYWRTAHSCQRTISTTGRARPGTFTFRAKTSLSPETAPHGT